MNIYYIYKITVNNFFYYGITKNLNVRKNKHYNQLKKNKHHNIILQRSFNKKNNFLFEILKTVNTKQEAIDLEIKYIKENHCVNMTSGGDGGDTISNHPNKVKIIKKVQKTRSQITFIPSEEFINNQGNIKKYGHILWCTYKCDKCNREIKGKSNFLRYHGENGELCGLPTKKYYNNGIIEKFMHENETKGTEWVKGRIKKS